MGKQRRQRTPWHSVKVLSKMCRLVGLGCVSATLDLAAHLRTFPTSVERMTRGEAFLPYLAALPRLVPLLLQLLFAGA